MAIGTGRWNSVAVSLVLLIVQCGSETPLQFESYADRARLATNVKRMFYHGYDSYLRYAFPKDELCPLTCSGKETWGAYALTLVDALDTLYILGNTTEFRRAVVEVTRNVDFAIDRNVSVFETNIRIVGGLLSAHEFASLPDANDSSAPWYDGKLLDMAIDIGQRLLPAFNTPTGIPYGTVNLLHGVPPGETTITSLAGAGTYLIEFGMLSRLTGDPVYEKVARGAMRGLWARRSALGLVGNHIDVWSGTWKYLDSGIGPNQDSFYEYLLKAYILFGDFEYLYMFEDFYRTIAKYMKKQDWYVDVHMTSGQVSLPWFTSLGAFWPGLQVLYGDVMSASKTMHTFQNVWRQFGFVPEVLNLQTGAIVNRLHGYFLRPEMIESTMYLYQATRDPVWTAIGLEHMTSIEVSTWTPCGYAIVRNVSTHELADRMESFYLSETLKYMYLLFDTANPLHHGEFVFSTEGHPFRVSPVTRNESFWGSSMPRGTPDTAPHPVNATNQTLGGDNGAQASTPSRAQQEFGKRASRVRQTCQRASLESRLALYGFDGGDREAVGAPFRRQPTVAPTPPGATNTAAPNAVGHSSAQTPVETATRAKTSTSTATVAPTVAPVGTATMVATPASVDTTAVTTTVGATTVKPTVVVTVVPAVATTVATTAVTTTATVSTTVDATPMATTVAATVASDGTTTVGTTPMATTVPSTVASDGKTTVGTTDPSEGVDKAATTSTSAGPNAQGSTSVDGGTSVAPVSAQVDPSKLKNVDVNAVAAAVAKNLNLDPAVVLASLQQNPQMMQPKSLTVPQHGSSGTGSASAVPSAPKVTRAEIEQNRAQLRDKCFALKGSVSNTFWSYEVCFGKSVWQYPASRENDAAVAKVSLGFRDVMDLTRSVPFSQVQALVDGTLLATGRSRLNNTAMVGEAAGKHPEPNVVQQFTNGQICSRDAETVHRRTTVFYFCREEYTDNRYAFKVEEPQVCEYIVKLYTRFVCGL
eukprot:m.782188 g.782188  ORF g.782188 m.782188 type:complete len:983 (-) comp23289_c0_seq8:5021-7969(-)